LLICGGSGAFLFFYTLQGGTLLKKLRVFGKSNVHGLRQGNYQILVMMRLVLWEGNTNALIIFGGKNLKILRLDSLDISLLKNFSEEVLPI